jgi:Fe2+ or Zn2+ uptake regulation protein
MTVDRQHGYIIFECDSCNEVYEVDHDDFDRAYAQVKQSGWKAIKIGKDWEHHCPDCQEEE